MKGLGGGGTRTVHALYRNAYETVAFDLAYLSNSSRYGYDVSQCYALLLSLYCKAIKISEFICKI